MRGGRLETRSTICVPETYETRAKHKHQSVNGKDTRQHHNRHCLDKFTLQEMTVRIDILLNCSSSIPKFKVNTHTQGPPASRGSDPQMHLLQYYMIQYNSAKH